VPNIIETCQEGSQERRQLTLAGILKLEKMVDGGSVILELYEKWQQGADISKARWIDVTADNPYEYVIHNHPGTVIGGRSDIRLKEYPVRMQLRSCAAEYLECKSRAQPTAHYVNQEFNGLQREYLRLMLPLANSSGIVQKIVYAVRHLKLPSPS